MRRVAVGAAAAAVFCMLALAGAWLLASRELRSEIAGWTERQRANGILFTHGEIEIGGFPFRLELTIPEPALAGADGARRWEGPAILASAPLWRPHLLHLKAPGRHRYQFSGSDGLAHEIVLDMLAAAGKAAIEEGRIRTLDLDASQVRITGTAPGEVVVGSLEVHSRLDPEHAADLKSESGSVALAASVVSFADGQGAAAAADPIQSVELQLALTGPLPWEAGEDDLARWRQAGGTLELRRLAPRRGLHLPAGRARADASEADGGRGADARAIAADPAHCGRSRHPRCGRARPAPDRGDSAGRAPHRPRPHLSPPAPDHGSVIGPRLPGACGSCHRGLRGGIGHRGILR